MRRWSWRILGLFLKRQTRAIIELFFEKKILTIVKNISEVNNLNIGSQAYTVHLH